MPHSARSLSSSGENLLQVNEELRRRVAELEALFELAPVGLAIARDPECRRIDPNPAMRRMLRLGLEANASRTARWTTTWSGSPVRPFDPNERITSGLCIRIGSAPSVVPRVLGEVDADQLHATRDFAPYGRKRDHAVVDEGHRVEQESAQVVAHAAVGARARELLRQAPGELEGHALLPLQAPQHADRGPRFREAPVEEHDPILQRQRDCYLRV